MMFWQQHGAHGTEETTAAHWNQESSIQCMEGSQVMFEAVNEW